MQQAMFILASSSIVALIIPFAWFVSFIKEIPSECGGNLQTEWLLIMSCALLALVLYLGAAVVIWWVREKFDQ